MFAVIKTGGKQFRVAANDRITTAKIEGNPGDTVAFGTVLMLTDGEKTTLDAKALSEITVAAEIVEQARGEKVIAFKKRRRQNSKRKRGFRAELTVIRITDILTGGKKPEMKKGEASPVALKAASTETKGKTAAKAAPKAAKAAEPKADDAAAPETKAAAKKAPAKKAAAKKTEGDKPAAKKAPAKKAAPKADKE